MPALRNVVLRVGSGDRGSVPAFDWFARVASADDRTGTITVIVSHRFLTVRTANLIVVMYQARVVESVGRPGVGPTGPPFHRRKA